MHRPACSLPRWGQAGVQQASAFAHLPPCTMGTGVRRAATILRMTNRYDGETLQDLLSCLIGELVYRDGWIAVSNMSSISENTTAANGPYLACKFDQFAETTKQAEKNNVHPSRPFLDQKAGAFTGNLNSPATICCAFLENDSILLTYGLSY